MPSTSVIRARENKQWKDLLEVDDLLLGVEATQLERRQGISTLDLSSGGSLELYLWTGKVKYNFFSSECVSNHNFHGLLWIHDLNFISRSNH